MRLPYKIKDTKWFTKPHILTKRPKYKVYKNDNDILK